MHTYSYIYIHTYKACLYQCYICKVNNVSYRGIKKYLFTYCKKKKKSRNLNLEDYLCNITVKCHFIPLQKKQSGLKYVKIFFFMLFSENQHDGSKNVTNDSRLLG